MVNVENKVVVRFQDGRMVKRGTLMILTQIGRSSMSPKSRKGERSSRYPPLS